MPERPADLNPEARRAAFRLAFENPRSPLAFERLTPDELLARVREAAPGASDEECLEALSRARRLSEDVYDISDGFRDGRAEDEASARKAALAALAGRNPGFTETEYETAFAAGLLWTAF